MFDCMLRLAAAGPYNFNDKCS